MKQVRQFFLAGAMVASTAFALPAAAQTPPSLGASIQGIVQSVDPISRTIHFQDGRTVVLAPGVTLLRDGRQLTMTELRPGMVVIVGATGTPSTAMQATTPGMAAGPVANHPPIDVTGVVASADPASGTIRLVDGRTVKATQGTQVFEATRLGELHGGDQVILRGVQPMSGGEGRMSSNTSTAAPATRELGMGTVRSVDTTNGVAALTDGRAIHLTPGQSLRYGNTTVTYLQPGDEIVFFTPTTSADAVSASPRGYDQRGLTPGRPAMLDATDVQIVWRAQRP